MSTAGAVAGQCVVPWALQPRRTHSLSDKVLAVTRTLLLACPQRCPAQGYGAAHSCLAALSMEGCLCVFSFDCSCLSRAGAPLGCA